jgi:diketogulonate reductase-like aldo/keto reductase
LAHGEAFEQVGRFLGGQAGQLFVWLQRGPRRLQFLLLIFARKDALLVLAVGRGSFSSCSSDPSFTTEETSSSPERLAPDTRRSPADRIGWAIDHEQEKSMLDRTLLIDGVSVPRFLYGTAWKEDQTRRLAELALRQGFRGIDTANQRRHYHEAAVGQAIGASVVSGLVAWDDLFLQTKFTFRRGQDERLPYDADAPIPVQVEQSFASSLEHLGVKVIDSFLLHGPSQRAGLASADWEAWRAMEAIHDGGQARLLGVSNVSLEQLQHLCQQARIRPRFVQNRCYAAQGWDRRVREFCVANELVYQGFSLLTANRQALARPELARIAERHGRTVSQVVFRFALAVGMIPLTGTTDADHMRADLEIFDFHLDPEEIARIEGLVLP